MKDVELTTSYQAPKARVGAIVDLTCTYPGGAASISILLEPRESDPDEPCWKKDKDFQINRLKAMVPPNIHPAFKDAVKLVDAAFKGE